jgi:hypothetical protein
MLRAFCFSCRGLPMTVFGCAIFLRYDQWVEQYYGTPHKEIVARLQGLPLCDTSILALQVGISRFEKRVVGLYI